jgi:hypothetical protein
MVVMMARKTVVIAMVTTAPFLEHPVGQVL